VGNICCSSACNFTCMACVQTLTGQPDGTCANIQMGKPAPATQCPASPPCGNDGNCNGSGFCEQAPMTTMCGAAASCMNGMVTPAGMCSGAGMCVPGTPTSCNGYVCNGAACTTKCNASNNTGCVAGYYCTGVGGNGTCTMQLGPGSPCTSNIECKSTMCVMSDGGAADGGDGGTDGGAGMVCN
jgi:hypothetical protein